MRPYTEGFRPMSKSSPFSDRARTINDFDSFRNSPATTEKKTGACQEIFRFLRITGDRSHHHKRFDGRREECIRTVNLREKNNGS